MFKVGQVYNGLFDDVTNKDLNFVVTYVGSDQGHAYGCLVVQDGYAEKYYEEDLDDLILLAEYPTWQEALASKEFKEDYKG